MTVAAGETPEVQGLGATLIIPMVAALVKKLLGGQVARYRDQIIAAAMELFDNLVGDRLQEPAKTILRTAILTAVTALIDLVAT